MVLIHKHDKATFVTHNDIMLVGCGHILLGNIKTKYESLVRTFGSPEVCLGSKTVDFIWRIQYQVGNLESQIVIYNQRQEYQPMVTDYRQIKNWLVKGYNKQYYDRTIKEIQNND